MNEEWKNSRDRSADVRLYPGIDLFYLAAAPDAFQHPRSDHILLINYCRAGQIAWEMKNGNRIYLNPGDFSLHTIRSCPGSAQIFPTKQYQGLAICVDLQETAAHPPELLRDTDIFNRVLRQKFCHTDAISFLAGNEQTEGIFSAFYSQTEAFQLAYRQLKVLELLLYLVRMDSIPRNRLAEYQSGQIDIVREIHDWLLQHMDQRITIEELSRQYLINPTTLKAAFKSVYGTSIAAHMKEHRMEQAARLLRETPKSIAEIAQAVGYDSQSKFTAAFKASFQVLPREYRKHCLKEQVPH